MLRAPNHAMNSSRQKNETSPGEFSVIGTCCGRRRVHGLGWPRSGGGTNRKEEISHSETASKLYESNLAGRLPAVWRAASQSFPCLRHCLTHKFLISTLVNNEHQALKRHQVEELVDLENATRVAGRESA